MFEKLKQSWRDFEEDTPGKRFQDYYKRRHQSRQSAWRKALFIAGGLLIVAAGVFMLIAPGPGLLVVFLGAVLIAQQSLLAARTLDWLELRLRALAAQSLRMWRCAPRVVKALLVVLAIALTGALAFGTYLLLFANNQSSVRYAAKASTQAQAGYSVQEPMLLHTARAVGCDSDPYAATTISFPGVPTAAN